MSIIQVIKLPLLPCWCSSTLGFFARSWTSPAKKKKKKSGRIKKNILVNWKKQIPHWNVFYMIFAGYVICGNPDKVGFPVVFSQFPTWSQNKSSESSEVLSIRVFAWFVLSCLLVFYDLNFLNALMLCRVIFTSPVFVCTVPGAHHRWWAPDGAKLRYYARPGLPPVPLVCLSTKWAVVPGNYFHTSLEKLKIIPHSMLSLGPHKLI